MTPGVIILTILGYFLVLLLISFVTAKRGDNDTFFLGNRKSPWYIVAFGMIGASLSGVTFISVPGWVEASEFSYMQMVIGYLLGYAIIAFILLPLYYRLQLTSIYTYLQQRFGRASYKTGASFFLISRIIGASFRLYLVALVLDEFVFKNQIEFGWIVVITIALIWVYTFRGGIKTIIWTDTLQTLCMLIAVVISILGISKALDLEGFEIITTIRESEYSRIFFLDDISDGKHFIKQFFTGAAIAVVMTGLDQDMMQKNLSCKNLKDAQKNMISFSLVLVFVNLLFLGLGALLYLYADHASLELPAKRDNLFPLIALEGGLGISLAMFFILGLIASAYSSADSALTALTTSFYVDILEAKKERLSEQKRLRWLIHVGMSLALLATILIFHMINDDSVIASLFKVAGFTYGPLLGMYAFGLFMKKGVKDNLVPVVAILSVGICAFLYFVGPSFGIHIGFELLIYNGLFTFLGMLIISSKSSTQEI